MANSQLPVIGSLFSTQHDQTLSRVLGTVYTNTTGKPMHVSVSVVNGGAASNLTLIVNGITQTEQGQASPGAVYQVSGIIPNGATYEATISSGGTLNSWVEVS